MRISLGISLVAAVGFSSLGWAQERREERRAERAAPLVRREVTGAIPHAVGTPDQQIAACLLAGARNEVEISKIAADKATSEEVRNFAAMMVKDHSPGLDRLREAAGPLASTHAPGTPAAEVKKEIREEIKEEAREPRREAPAKDTPVAAPPGGRREAAEPRGRVVAEERTVVEARPASGLDWVAIHKQVADQCLASAKAELGKKEGAEFDHCYMGQQIMAHMQMIDHLKVLRNYASPDLRKDLDEASQLATSHLEHAQKIAQSMKQDSDRVSRKPKAE